MSATARARGATRWVVAGSAVSGLAAYAFQVAAARFLGEQGYAPIGVLWTLQYLAFSVPLISVEAYLARVRALPELEPTALRGPLRRVAWLVLGVALLVGCVTYVGRGSLFHGEASLALVAAAIVGAYGAFAIARGLLAGAERFRLYGLGTGAESLARLLVALPVLALVGTTSSLAWIMPVGPVAVGMWWVTERRARGAPPLLGTRGMPPSAAPRAGRTLLALTVANACAQTLLAAGPLVLVLLGAGPVEVSVFFVTTTAARAPLQFLLGGLLSRVLPPMTRLAIDDEAGLRRLVLLLGGGGAATSVAGAAAGWVAGPAIIGLLFGEGFRPPALLAGLTGFTVLAVSACLLLGQVFVARGTAQRVLVPWLTAVGVAVAAIVVLDGTPTTRVASGVAMAVAVALAWLTARARRRPPSRHVPGRGCRRTTSPRTWGRPSSSW